MRACLLLCATVALPAAALRQELLVDASAVRAAAAWSASASDQVKASIKDDRDGSLCLDYDFGGVSGYAVMRRVLPMQWPERFDLVARIRGHGGRNDLQVKLIDASGDNVWWLNRQNEALPAKLTDLRIRRRHIEFAWGPTADRALRQTQFIEFVVAAGRDGGRGSLCLAQLTLVERAPDLVTWPAPKVAHRPSSIDIDYGVAREFNGLALRWPPSQRSFGYDVLTSNDGRRWRLLRRVRSSDGGLDALFLPESEARHLRLRGSSRWPPDIAVAVELKSAADWPGANAVLTTLAADAPRGDMPRAFLGEQNYWTLVGVDGGGERSGLISEDGAIEVGRGGYSIEPSMQLPNGQRVTWADVAVRQSLREGYLPLPAVRWTHAAFTLDIEATADGPPEVPVLLARYRLTNTGAETQTLTLMLAVRPWQVNPPQQFLSRPGGTSPIDNLRWDGAALRVGNRAPVRFAPAAQAVGALGADGGASLAALAAAPALKALEDPQHGLSAALQFKITLAPGAVHTVGWAASLGPQAAGAKDSRRAAAGFEAHPDARFDAVAEHWRSRLNRTRIDVPAAPQPIVDTLRTSLAHILMSRDGVALRPGTRSYARTWIRDGAMMAAGLLRLQEVDAARAFVDWYAGHIFASGKVPCCVDRRGADPVVENDSHGQYLYAVADVWRHSRDLAFLQRHWPQVQRVVAWQEGLRQSERGASNRTPTRAHLFGLMPPSISHEGYSDKPAYSYWDNFWALRGFKDAVHIAAALGMQEEVMAWAVMRDGFAAELNASVLATARHHGLSTIAGAADRGDFDATSTTMALDPAQAALPPLLIEATFERYWQEASARTEGRRESPDYTPYELRNVGALLRLGHADRAHAMLDFFFKDQRPAGWNQWAEVVLPQPRKPRFLGDMPHAWVSSDYIRSALDLFAYERESDAALLIGAGLRLHWLSAGDIAVHGLSTAHGLLDWRLSRLPADRPTGWHFAWSGATPPGGARLLWPGTGALPRARHLGNVLPWQGRELPLPAAPASVEILE